MIGLRKARPENYFSLFCESLLANDQLEGGILFSDPLNKSCNYLLVCVVVAEGNVPLRFMKD